MCDTIKQRLISFLLTPLREGRLVVIVSNSVCLVISTHAPAGGATGNPGVIFTPHVFLLTPLREGRRSVSFRLIGPISISTHAPAGGATYVSAWLRTFSRISTHAPAGGATVLAHRTFRIWQNFYSRPCGRGDEAELSNYIESLHYISTHAPAGGATSSDSKIVAKKIFLLTPLREGRPVSPCFSRCHLSIFLLTPLREGRRHQRPRGRSGQNDFYSRPCGRGDIPLTS